MENTYHTNYLFYDQAHSHRHFGGIISQSDFCSDHPPYPGQVTGNILRSLRFDNYCRRQFEQNTLYKLFGGDAHE